jgi:hypothetical protein
VPSRNPWLNEPSPNIKNLRAGERIETFVVQREKALSFFVSFVPFVVSQIQSLATDGATALLRLAGLRRIAMPLPPRLGAQAALPLRAALRGL